MPKITSRIEESTEKFLSDFFRNKTQGGEYVLETFPVLYRRTLHYLKERFTANELGLLIDVFNGLWLMPQVAGQHIEAEVWDGMTLNGADEKWKIDRDTIMAKIKALAPFERVVMEIWGSGFWTSGAWEDHEAGVEKWIAQLTTTELNLEE